MDRTPTYARLVSAVRSLEQTVQNIYANVPITNLDAHSMVEVLRYLDRDFEQPREHGQIYEPIKFFGLAGSVVSYDIGYKLIKDQLERDLVLPGHQKRFLLDGVIGWLFYNPGTKHQEVMDGVLCAYVFAYGLDDLNTHFPIVRDMFERFRTLSVEAEEEVLRTLQDPHEQTFFPIFSQFFYSNKRSHLNRRAEQIAKIFPEFRTK